MSLQAHPISVAETAVAYAKAGFYPIPLQKQDKVPARRNWQNEASNDLDKVRAWFAGHKDNIGLLCGERAGMLAIDIDKPKHTDDADGETGIAALEDELGNLPPTLTNLTGGGGRQLVFKYPAGRHIGNTASQLAHNVDTRGNGGQIAVAPSVHPNGRQYAWENLNVSIAELPPAWAEKQEQASEKQQNPLKVPSKNTAPSASGAPPAIMAGLSVCHPYAQKAFDEECAKVAGAQEGTRNNTMNTAAFSLGTLVGGGELDEVLARSRLLDAALKCGLPYDEAVKTIDSGLASGKQQPRSIPEVSSTSTKESEESIASAFTARYKDTLRFCKELGCWFEWDPQKHIWKEDKVNRAFDYARRACKTLNPSNKATLGKSSTAQGVERFARADPRHATTQDLWDKDPFLLGTPDGVINLKI